MKPILKTLILMSVSLLAFTTSCKKETLEVTSIEFTNVSRGKLTLPPDDDFRIKYEITPVELEATAELVWTSSNEDVATVRNGRISSHEEGKAVITATCGNVSESVVVTVESIEADGFDLPSSIFAYKGRQVRVDVTNITPDGANLSGIEWSISDESIASWEIEEGDLYVTALKDGSTTLTGKAGDVIKNCTITVKEYVPVTNVTVKLAKTEIGLGTSTTVSVTISPSNASIKDVKWEVSPSSLVTFNEATKTLTAGDQTGSVTITATVDGVSGSAQLSIVPPLVESISLSYPKDFPYGHMSPDGSVGNYPKTLQLTATVTPANASGKTITWKSYDESRATVDQNGLVTAVGHGAVLIEAECDGVKATKIVRPFKRESINWTAYDGVYEPITEMQVLPYGYFSASIRDSGAWYTNEEGKRTYASYFYYYENGDFYTPKVNLPSGVMLVPEEVDYSTYYIIFYATSPISSQVTVNMGVGSGAAINFSSGIKSISLIQGYSSTPVSTIASGGTITVTRPTYSDDRYTVYVNYNSTYSNDYDYSRSASFSATGPTSGSGWSSASSFTITPSTVKGSYTMTMKESTYTEPVTFTLIIK